MDRKGVRFYARVCFGILPPLNCSPRPSIPPFRTQNKPLLAFSFGRSERRGRKGGKGEQKREPGRPRATMETRNSLARGKKKGVALPVNSPVVVSPPASSYRSPPWPFCDGNGPRRESLGYYSANSRQPVRAYRSDLEGEHPVL